MPARELSGTTPLVTGASRGFGRAVAIAIATHGANVVGSPAAVPGSRN
jgi:NAD(P)-dependent dehydrogenase (short-subunit alcohol dehydrogenase family)